MRSGETVELSLEVLGDEVFMRPGPSVVGLIWNGTTRTPAMRAVARDEARSDLP